MSDRLPGETREDEVRLSSMEAERGLLSCVMQNPLECLMPAWERFPSVDVFTHEPHRIIWETMLEMHGAGKPLGDGVAITQVLNDKELLYRIGGPGLVTDLFTFITVTGHFEYYIEVLTEKWLLRQLVDAGRDTVREALEAGRDDLDTTAVMVISEAERRTFELLQSAQKKKGGPETRVLPSREMCEEWQEKFAHTCANRGKVLGQRTGFFDLDRMLHGLGVNEDGDLILCGAFPGMGKTTMGVTEVEQAAIEQGIPTAVFPLEMGRMGFHDRLVLGRARVNTSVARNGFISNHLKQTLPGVLREIAEAPIHWDHRASITMSELRATVTTLVRTKGVKFVVIDHFGQLRPSTKQGINDERLGQKEIMETLHDLRRNLGVVILLLVQLDKKAREKGDKNILPGNGDIRGASEMVEYPTHIMFLHRPCVPRPWAMLDDDRKERWEQMVAGYRCDCPDAWTDPRRSGEEYEEWKTCPQVDYEEHALIKLGKNRNGPTDDALCVRWRPWFQRFENRTTELYSNNDKYRQVRLPGF